MKARGQGLVEYVLILGLIVLVVIILAHGPGVFVDHGLSSVVREFPQ